MKPTNKLRFIRGEIGLPILKDSEDITNPLSESFVKIILQQWWEADDYNYISEKMNGEWRDVPIEKE